MASSVFSCDSDIRIDHPFPKDERMWALWAAQNCRDYDLLITVMLDEMAVNKMIGYVGADLTDKGCVRAPHYGDVQACEFNIKARTRNFGILFAGGFSPVFYVTEWQEDALSWQPAWDWWWS